MAEVCGTPVSRGITDADREAIMDMHNKLRNRVAEGKETRGPIGPQPPAANMRMLEWDEELAKVAQRWADQCQFAHDVVSKLL